MRPRDVLVPGAVRTRPRETVLAHRCGSKFLSAPTLSVLLAGLGAVGLLLSSDAAATAGPEAQKLVVVVYPSEYDGAPGIVLVNRAIRSTLANQWPGHIDIRNEYVNTSRLQDADFMQAHVALLKRKYAGEKIDLVIAGLSAGLDFALKFREDLFPGVPIVFVAVDEREVKARRLPPDVIGVPIRMDLARTLDLALRLHPATRRVFVIAGSSPFDTEWENEARRTFRAHENRVEFVYLSGLRMDELIDRVAGLPPQSIIYFLHLHQDATGKPYFSAEVLERLAVRANAPIYGHVDTYVGRGAVGGHVFRFEEAGTNAAHLGLRLLAGEKPESIAVPEASANADLFDWRQLQRWGIHEQSLPPGSIVLHRKLSFWDAYRWHIVGVVSLCVVQAVLIVGLLIQRVQRRRAEDRFRQVVEAAPTGMLMVGRDGTIVLANAQVEILFGYTRDDLIGRSVEMVLPDRVGNQQPTDCGAFFTAREVRPQGLGLFLKGRREDGSEFPVEMKLSPMRAPEGHFFLASIVDLTERRRAEDGLRASQRELQLLTGRLLEAQESERRRIARELHDDLNQALALVSMDLDLLSQRPPDSASQTAEWARELSERVKELSTTVHDLSHQLHPSKLEQLGLVAAIRGLCKELAQHHGLNVKFTHDDVPEVVPDATALCLYRIVQEALRNVVKHGGTDFAAVELYGASNEIQLRVSDDGTGFDLASASGNGGLGIVSMRERLHLVGGEITIDSRPFGGTRIDIRIPAPGQSRLEGAFQTEAASG